MDHRRYFVDLFNVIGLQSLYKIMTYLRHLTLFQLEQLKADKEKERAEFRLSLKTPQHFSYGALRLFRANATRLKKEINEIQRRIELQPDYQKQNYKKFKKPAL
jgi:hypothetical protein